MTIRSYIENNINEARIRRLRRILQRINLLKDEYQRMSDAQLQSKTQHFKERLQAGETLDDLLPEAFATVREASNRVLKMFPKDVQLLGAITLHEGNIAEMQTGEGKTLTATMPLYLNALEHSALLITTNDYLARRDFEEMQPLFHFLGLSSALGFVDDPAYVYQENEKKAIYANDIIYTTNGRLGFDYLIDNLADSAKDKFLGELKYCIIDEIDSVILDAAQTPLVISGAPRVQSNLFQNVSVFVQTLKQEEDFEMNISKKEIWLTPRGIDKAAAYFGVSKLYSAQHVDLVKNINFALRARYLFISNIDYLVYNGEVILIDRITGRMLPGTKLQSGLHQAIEAKEHMEISKDMSVMATITFQNLFKQFDRFAGMSATGKLGEKEFFDVYQKIVVQIPTDKPIQRIDKEDRAFVTKEDKTQAIIEEVIALYQAKRPVLLITRTAEDAEYFSEHFAILSIPNNLLIAQNIPKEAQMIAEAGQRSAVTVATSLAGRGTDIKLDAASHDLGGLAVIISEHMESSRIDRQLRGRAGRQGDPGSSQVFISLDDYLVERYGSGKLLENDNLKTIPKERLESSRFFKRSVTKIVERAQRVSEEQGMIARELASEFEKSISSQRSIIYNERNKVLNKEHLTHFNFAEIAREVFTDFAASKETFTQQEILNYIYKNITFQYNAAVPEDALHDKEALIHFLMERYEAQVEIIKRRIQSDYFLAEYKQKVILKAIDAAWINQVDYLQQLKSNIGNRKNGHRNVIFEYHKVALESFNEMVMIIKRKIIRNITLSMITFDKKQNMTIHYPE